MPEPQQPIYHNKAEYNFSPASDLDELVWGSARPGAKEQKCYDPKDRTSKQAVLEWIGRVQEKGITHAVNLLSASESQTYEEPLDVTLKGQLTQAHFDGKAGSDALSHAIWDLERAAASGHKAVVFCWGGGGRTGLALAGYLSRRYHLSAQEAADKVNRFATVAGTARRVDVDALQEALHASAQEQQIAK